MTDAYTILFGDIHNHNSLGYGIGSLERSIEIARGHLDFFAFTGHSSWHDIEPMEGGREAHWLRGFERLRQNWPKVQSLTADANEDGEFCSFLGFEWHSSRFGDQCVIFPDDYQELCFANHVSDLRRFCLSRNALMIPHHLAYPTGMRGVNWDVFDESCTPVVEIYSEHGNSEDDRGPFPFFNHSMGGRVTDNTARAALGRGLRFGFVASSDSHNGFPGAYGEGLMAALCRDLTREAVLEAIRTRRTYALTGDRIEIEFFVNDAPMGSTIATDHELDVVYGVRGRDELEVVELIRDGLVVQRSYPQEQTSPELAPKAPIQVRLEWGWGPWGDLTLDRVCDWEFKIAVSGGRILRYFPCLQSGPFDEQRRHRIVAAGDAGLDVRSYTSRRGAYRGNPNQSVILELDAGPDLAIEVMMTTPEVHRHRTRLADLYEGSQNYRAGPFPKESYQWHRIVPLAASALSDRCTIPLAGRRSNVYLRVKQKNGQMAWASPVFVNY